MYANKKGFTRRGFPVSELDIERAKVAARAAGQSLNVWVQRAIHAALETQPPAASLYAVAAPVAQLAALVDRLERLAPAAWPQQHTGGQEAERAFDDAPESGLDELQL